jgi:hypothetical protein
MLIGQTGYFGTLCYLIALFLLIYFIIKKLNGTKYLYAAIFPLIYLLISSMGESAFVNPIAVPLALCIGMALRAKQIELKLTYNNLNSNL